MGAQEILGLLAAKGLAVRRVPGGNLAVSPKDALTDELRALIRSHKAELLAALVQKHDVVFEFAPPSDPANDDEALDERVAILVFENGWTDAVARQEARWQADRERCWRAFIRNAARVLEGPRSRWEGMFSSYQLQAAARYGDKTGRDMAASLRAWVLARGVH